LSAAACWRTTRAQVVTELAHLGAMLWDESPAPATENTARSRDAAPGPAG